jgi:Holliday junction resolvase RusA-like endonuclease
MSELIPASSLWPQDGVWSNPDREELQYFITIAGPPASMPRPTSMAWLKDGKLKKRVFNGKAKEIKSFREECKSQLMGQGVTAFPVHPSNMVTVDIIFYRKVPKTSHHVVRTYCGTNQNTSFKMFDQKKPDIDNLIKFVMDGLTGIFYKDDDQVVRVCAVKMMDTEEPFGGRTSIKLSVPPV